MKTIEHDEYRVSERVVLRKGDLFRASGGPYYIVHDETGKRVKASMAAKGPFRFISYNERGRRKWITAYSTKEGSFVALAVSRWKTIDIPNFVNRPYKIIGKKRAKKQ